MFAGRFRGKTIWVSGHTGFKGAWLAEWLTQLGAKVHGFALAPNTTPSLFEQLGLGKVLDSEIGDVRDAAKVRSSVTRAQPDFIFHLAAQPIVRVGYVRPVETFETNVMGTVNVLEALRSLDKPCGAVFVTSDKCYHNREWVYGYREEDILGGCEPYSSSKAAAEIAIAAYRRTYFQETHVRVASARAGNVIGGGDWSVDRIVPDCVRALEAGKAIKVRNKQATRPWQHVLDPLSGYLWLAVALTADLDATGPGLCFRSGAVSSAFNFGPARCASHTVAELVREVLKHWPGTWLDESDPSGVPEARDLAVSTDKAIRVLGWSAVWDFSRAVAKTVEWYHAPGKQKRKMTEEQISDYVADARAKGLLWATL